jgi:hypothetical protein
MSGLVSKEAKLQESSCTMSTKALTADTLMWRWCWGGWREIFTTWMMSAWYSLRLLDIPHQQVSKGGSRIRNWTDNPDPVKEPVHWYGTHRRMNAQTPSCAERMSCGGLRRMFRLPKIIGPVLQIGITPSPNIPKTPKIRHGAQAHTRKDGNAPDWDTLQ